MTSRDGGRANIQAKKISAITTMIGPVHRDRLTPAALAIEAGVALRPSMVTTTPKMRNRAPIKVRRSKSLARRSA